MVTWLLGRRMTVAVQDMTLVQVGLPPESRKGGLIVSDYTRPPGSHDKVQRTRRLKETGARNEIRRCGRFWMDPCLLCVTIQPSAGADVVNGFEWKSLVGRNDAKKRIAATTEETRGHGLEATEAELLLAHAPTVASLPPIAKKQLTTKRCA